MRRFFAVLLFVAGTMLGCAQNHFNVPTDNFAQKVKVLGVAPIMIDNDSDLAYPQKDQLISLITDLNRKYEPLLTKKLQSTGNFYAVTLLGDEPRQLFTTMMARREKRDDANTQYNKFFWKNDEIAAYIKKNRLDAVMVVVVSGLSKTSKIYSSNLLTSLETNFNFLTLTAQILSADGTVLWEYPNFRGRLLPYYPLVNLQYPDFSESEANLSRKTEVRFKSLDGIRRTLEQKKSDWLLRETQEPEVYGRLFDEITSLIKYDADKPEQAAAPDGKAATPRDETHKPTAVPEKSGMPEAAVAPAPATAVTPVREPAPTSAVETPAAPAPAPNAVVPAVDGAR
jgi:hypothetical protein